MASLLYRLGRTAYRRWPIFLVTWLVIIAAVGGFSAKYSHPMSNTFTIPGIQSLKAADTQKQLFPQATPADKQVTGQVVVAAPTGHTLAEQPYKGQVDQLVAQLQKAPQVNPDQAQQMVSPVVAGPMFEKKLEAAAAQQHQPVQVAQQNAQYLSPLSKDGRIGLIQWNFNVSNSIDMKTDTQDYVNHATGDAQKNGLTAVAGGTGMQAMSDPGGSSEMIGVGIALVVLVVTFGSFVAAGLPIVTAGVGVGLGTLGVKAATHFFDIPSTATALSSMIGLAVGIDYSLFILSRYRGELKHTNDRSHAMGRAIGTAGSAVVFAGLTVVIALSAFAVLGIPMLTAMGLAAAATVVFAVLMALTLLPAILGLLKGKAFAGSFRKDSDVDEEDHEVVNGSVRLGNLIRRAPAVVTVVLVALFALAAIPVHNLHLGLPTDATVEKGTPARTSADLIAEGFGPGRNAPMIAVVDARDTPAAQRPAVMQAAVKWASTTDGVANAQVIQANQDQSGAVMLITPKTGPADVATDHMLKNLRDNKPQAEVDNARVGITGLTAINNDVSDKLNSALAPYLAIVVGLAFILLMIVFRSIVVPLLATLGFVLSVLATLGITSKLVQDGWFGVFDKQPIMSFLPTLLVGIVFGLAMDYQVFLTTRMREAYSHGMDAKDAVIDGFRHSGRVVTAAALIMISVFAAFAGQSNALIKEIGVALAAAVFLDAFLVRMILIPAIMLLLGRHAWWIPKWLDRILPTVDVEGHGLAQHTEEPAPAGAAATSAVTTGSVTTGGATAIGATASGSEKADAQNTDAQKAGGQQSAATDETPARKGLSPRSRRKSQDDDLLPDPEPGELTYTPRRAAL